MNTFQQFIRYSLVIVLMAILLGSALIVVLMSRSVAWRLIRSFNSLALKVFGISVETQYESEFSKPEGGGVIVSLNQESLLNPTIAYAAWERRVMSIWNIEYALIPFMGWSTLITGWVIVRQWPTQAKSQLLKAAKYAREGGLVHLSAEGERSANGQLNSYKKGPVVLAIEAQVPIYPVYLVGSRACLPFGEWKIRPGNTLVKYLSPISTAGLSYKDRNSLLEKLTKIAEAEHQKWN